MESIQAAELAQWKKEGRNYVLIDVRETWEREEFHIGGTHLPMGELAQRINEIPRDTDIVVYCEKGIRSVIALQRLELAGYTRLYNLTGGMRAWKEQ